MTLSSPPPSEQEIETYLQAMPRMQMSARGDELFFSRLSSVLVAQQSMHRTADEEQERSGFLTGFRRFSFSFGLGVFAVGVAFTAISYQDTVTHGSLLYPWKQAAEQVEGQLAFSTEDKVDGELRFADRRLREAWNIIGDEATPTASLFVPIAHATDASVLASLDSESAAALGETLADMNNHLNKASKIVEAAPLKAQEAVSLLDTIAARADAQITSLKDMKKKTPTRNRFAVSAAAHSQESYVVSVIVAREEIRSLIDNKGPQTAVKLTDFSKLVASNFAIESQNTQGEADEADRAKQASNVLNALEKKMNGLTLNDRTIAQARVVEAKRALSEGKTATAFGLSIAITNQLAQQTGVPQQHANGANALSVEQPNQATPLPTGVRLLPAENTPTSRRIEIQAQVQPNVLDLVEKIPTRAATQINLMIPTAQTQENIRVNNTTAPTIITPTPYSFSPTIRTEVPQSNLQQQQPLQVTPLQTQQQITSPILTQPTQTIVPQTQVQINVPLQNNSSLNFTTSPTSSVIQQHITTPTVVQPSLQTNTILVK